jgi:hypothetical protein
MKVKKAEEQEVKKTIEEQMADDLTNLEKQQETLIAQLNHVRGQINYIKSKIGS